MALGKVSFVAVFAALTSPCQVTTKVCPLLDLLAKGIDIRGALKGGANPNCWDESLTSPLLSALKSQQAGAASDLLDFGADPNAHRGAATPLSYAAAWGNEAVVSKLLDRGADPLARGSLGTTALMWAQTPRIAAILMAKGIPVDARDELGRTALHYAAGRGPDKSVDLIRFLLAHGADANTRDKSGGTSLEAAVQNDCQACLAPLFQAHADSNLASDETPLMIAVERNKRAEVDSLLTNGARVWLWSSSGRTTLDFVDNAGDPEIARLLRVKWAEEVRTPPSRPLPAAVSLNALRWRSWQIQSQPDSRIKIGRMGYSAFVLWRSWDRMNRSENGRQQKARLSDSNFSKSLSRDVYILDLAYRTNSQALFDAVSSDLAIKAEDCDARNEGLGGDVPLTIKAIRNGEELKGWRVRYVERFIWDLQHDLGSFNSQWQECAGLSTIEDEPIPAGSYVMVVRSPDGSQTSEPKLVDVSSVKPRRIAIAVQ